MNKNRIFSYKIDVKMRKKVCIGIFLKFLDFQYHKTYHKIIMKLIQTYSFDVFSSNDLEF